MIELYYERKRKARKDHKCYECGRRIRKGEKYTVVTGCWDGTFDEFKMCNYCTWLRDRVLVEATYYEEIYFGQLLENANEFGMLGKDIDA